MILPLGNPLFEHISLNLNDVQTLMDNLTKNKFSGYIAIEENRKIIAGFFFSSGEIKSAFELNNSGDYQLAKNSTLLSLVSSKVYEISSYVLSPKLVDILSYLYLFVQQGSPQDVKSKDFEKFLSSMEANSISGFLIISALGKTKEIVLSQGRIVYDSFAAEYGNILCRSEEIDQFVADFPRSGAQITVYGEQSYDLENKDIIAKRTLEFEKELIIKTARGLLGGNEMVKIDESYFKEWSVKPSAVIHVELTIPTGSAVAKCTSARNLSGNISIPAAILRKYNLTEGALIKIKPVME